MRLWPKSEYVRHLEAEVIRLRTELQRWQDAMLVKDGLPRISRDEAPKLVTQPKSKLLPSQWKRRMELESMPVETKKEQ